jgi:glycosyltransferase involved in cell wall biosynthesis
MDPYWKEHMKGLHGKHILLVVENESVPFDRRMWNIALALKEFGAQVTVVCPVFGEDNAKYELIDGITIYRYQNKYSDGSIKGYFREYIIAFFKTLFFIHKVIIRKGHIDVCHVANPPDIFWLLALYLRIFGTRFIFDEHDLAPETYLSRFAKVETHSDSIYKILKIFQRLSYRFAHVIISTNETYKAVAKQIVPDKVSNIFVVRNGPDTRWFRLVPPRIDLKLGHKYLASYIGVMAVQDGVEYILRAVDIIKHQRGFNDLIVYLIGSGDDWNRLKRLSKELGVNDSIVFTGRIHDDPALEILSTSDVCLSPDPYNPLNDSSTMTKIMEYMALGKAIVSFDLKEARYSAGESALYVENNSAEAFADGILTLLKDPDRCLQMGTKGKDRVAKLLSWQNQVEQLRAAYDKIIQI